ncbi:hypothetical protein BSL78_27817 [Apostichopus japonicus]|uniref:Uncharacterized protein n=1 Tax=Stichopus japonicus TaxID=307972 RepID=A0A2G8JI03_STIJA|nr:hypothetical protein BSL78_27817 [Apostichopus japonicus]
MNVDHYKNLAEVAMMHSPFYRRRPSEVEMITIEVYLEQTNKKNPVQDEILQSMTTAEKIAIACLTLIMVRGKGDEGSLCSPPHYIFERITSSVTTPLRAYECMTELAPQANLEQPENVRTSKLCKHIATASHILGLQISELEQLANHLGYDIQIHINTIDYHKKSLMLAKESKLLIMADKGKLHKFAGISLDEIKISPGDVLDNVLTDDEEDEADTEEDDVDTLEDEAGH